MWFNSGTNTKLLSNSGPFVLSAIFLIGLISMTGISYRELALFSSHNAETRLDRASVTAAILFKHWMPDTVRWDKDEKGTPTRIVVGANQARLITDAKQPLLGMAHEISLTNQGSANVFVWDKASGQFNRVVTTMTKPDGTPPPALSLTSAHPAYAALSRGMVYRGDVPVMGRLRYAFLTPLVDVSDHLIGALTVDVGWSDDLVAAKTSLLNKLVVIASALGLLLLAITLFVMSKLLRAPIAKLSAIMKDSSAATRLATENDDIGVLAHGIQQLRRRADELNVQVRIDPLTGLGNRQQFDEALDSSLTGDHSGGAKRYVVLLDLDHFKRINDELGHPAGDAVLRETAKRLKSILPDISLMRNGGDEFAAIGPIADIDRVALRIISEISQPIHINGAIAHVGMSIGIVQIDNTSQSGGDLYNKADLALYKSKNTGRGQYTVYTEQLSVVERKCKNHATAASVPLAKFGINIRAAAR